MHSLSVELAEIFYDLDVDFSRAEILKMLESEWPEIHRKEAMEIAKNTLQIIYSINFLKSRFSKGVLPRKMKDIPEMPCDPEAVEIGMQFLNRHVSEKNMIAFPKIIREDIVAKNARVILDRKKKESLVMI